MSKYIDKAELRIEIERFRLEGRASERLGEMILALADGCSAYCRSEYDDEVYSRMVLAAIVALPKVKPEAEPFYFLTQAMVFAYKRWKRDWQSRFLSLNESLFD